MTEKRIYRTSAETNILTMQFVDENKKRAENDDFLAIDLKNQLSVFSHLPITPITNGLMIVLGYTGNAKTTFMKIVMSEFCATLKDPNDIIVYINYEESIEELGLKDITRLSVVNPSDVIRGKIKQEEYDTMKTVSVDNGSKPIWTIADSIYDLDFAPQPNLDTIAKQLMMIRKIEEKRIRLVVIDYFQLIPLMIKNPSREGHARNATTLQRLGNIIGCPIIVASQTNRNPQDRGVKIPKIMDGAETSSIEKSARAVYGVYLPWKDKEDLGDFIKINGIDYKITPDLFVTRLLKQKHNPDPLTVVSYIDFEKMKLNKYSKFT